MKLSSLLLGVWPFVFCVEAGNCKNPYRYCAQTLRSIGYSNDTIMEALNKGGCIYDRNPDHYLFYCDRNQNLAFDHFGYCRNDVCIDAGAGKHDHCENHGKPIAPAFCPKTEAEGAGIGPDPRHVAAINKPPAHDPVHQATAKKGSGCGEPTPETLVKQQGRIMKVAAAIHEYL